MTQSIVPKNMVLYADDDPDDLELVTEAFKHYSSTVDVTTFQNGAGLLSYLNELSIQDTYPCLIILDMNMPLLNGKEVLEKIRQRPDFKDVPVVLFTTSSQQTDRDFAESRGVGFVTKPLNYTQMEFIAEKFISHCTEETRNRMKKAS